MPVKVLWVVKGLGPGGAETLLAGAAQAHDRDRFHVECAYVLPYKDHLAGRLEDAGVVTHCVSTGARDLRWPWRLARLVRHGGYDVVHVHSPLPGSVARAAARTMGRNRPRIVATEHNSWSTFSTATRWANRLTSRWNDVTFAVSDEARESVRGRARAHAVTLVHGIDVAATAALGDRDAVRAELGLNRDGVVIGTVANFRAQKDHPNLLRAAALLTDAGVDARWVVVGQGPLEAETRALAASLGIADRVTFTGFREDAVRVMSAVDVFTLASSWEGLPVALMEAMALGLPVVATAVGGVAETLHDGVDAVLVPPRDAAALAAGWRRVIEDVGERARLAAASLARAPEFEVARTQAVVEATYALLTPAAAAADVPDQPAPARRRAAALDIRPATAVDRHAVLQLLQRSMGRDDDPRFEALFRWKHDDNAFGPSPAWVATDGGDVVAARFFMRWEFVRGGRVVRAVRAVDTATDPTHQGHGLFTALTLHALDAVLAEGVDLVFNTPNAQSRPGYLKMGWREVGSLPAAVRPSGPASLVAMARAKVPAAHWSEPIDVGLPFLDWADQWAAGPAEWHTVADPPVRTLVTHTSEAFARWRFGLPALHYRAVPHGDGAVVVRLRRRGPARELVHVASFGLLPAAADRALVRVMKDADAHHVIRLGPPDLRHGFTPLPGGGPMLTCRALTTPGVPPLSNWSLTMGDVELF